MKFAVIDIGSNTAKTEIYKYKDGLLEMTDKKYVKRDMLADHKDGGSLDGEGVAILIDIMREFRAICLSNGIKRIFPYATQSLRGIDNADDVIEAVKKETGFDIEIISGEEEARLCFEAFCGTGLKCAGVLTDMGGGSTEISVMEGGALTRSVSIPVGSRSVVHEYGIDVMPTDEQECHIEEKIVTLARGLKSGEGGSLYACGGTSSGMFRLYGGEGGIRKKAVSPDELYRFYKECKTDVKKAEEAAKKLTADRYDTVYTGLLMHVFLCRALKCDTVVHCKSTCRQGYAARLVRDGKIK